MNAQAKSSGTPLHWSAGCDAADDGCARYVAAARAPASAYASMRQSARQSRKI